jgi:hypothetical protein
MENTANSFNQENQCSDFIPEKKLWRAVICQALYDALSDLEGRQITSKEKEMAESWFVNNTGNFKRACECADFDPDYLSKKVCELLKLKKLKQLGIVWNAKKRKVIYAG